MTMIYDYKNYVGFKESEPSKIKEVMRDTIGRQRTASLFEESIQIGTRENGYEPLYSLREYENNAKPSAYQIYMHSIDEADAAKKLVGNYQHWRKLCSLKWFIDGVVEWGFEGLAAWRTDMAARDKTIAKKGVMNQIYEGNITAAKTLHKMALDEEKAAGLMNKSRQPAKSPSKEESHIVEFLQKHKEK